MGWGQDRVGWDIGILDFVELGCLSLGLSFALFWMILDRVGFFLHRIENTEMKNVKIKIFNKQLSLTEL